MICLWPQRCRGSIFFRVIFSIKRKPGKETPTGHHVVDTDNKLLLANYSRCGNEVYRKMCWQSDIIQTHIFHCSLTLFWLHLLWQSQTSNTEECLTDREDTEWVLWVSLHFNYEHVLILGKMHAIIFQGSYNTMQEQFHASGM